VAPPGVLNNKTGGIKTKRQRSLNEALSDAFILSATLKNSKFAGPKYIFNLIINYLNMKFVSEDIIDAVIEELEAFSDEQYEQQMEAFAEAQPVLFAWLFSEHFDLLNEDEKGYLQYLALIAWNSIVKVNGLLEAVSEEQIGEAEEKNYEMLELSAGKKFRDRLDPFFEDSDQEDLIAFAEEAVLEDEEDPESLVTKEGREPIFIALKSMVDALSTGS